MKYCLKCEKKKPENDFWDHKFTIDGKATYCKKCAIAYNKKWKIENAEKVKLYKKIYPNKKSYRETNPKQWYDYFKKYKKERYKSDPIFKLKHILAYVIKNEKCKQGEKYKHITKCTSCLEHTEKIRATYLNNDLQYLLKLDSERAIQYTDIKDKIVWLCPKCTVKKEK